MAIRGALTVVNSASDFQHKGLQITLGGNFYFAPLHSSPKNVLDVGTGTGIWAIEFGKIKPRSSLNFLINIGQRIRSRLQMLWAAILAQFNQTSESPNLYACIFA